MNEAAVSEDEIIARYFAPLAAPGAFGLRDDCALITPEAGEDLVVTVDAVAEGVHFLEGTAPRDIAWRALAVNVSDLAAKGAKPRGYVMAISFASSPTHAWLAAFSEGLSEAQAAFGIALLGGDTDRRPGPLSIAITAWGSVPHGRMVRRTTAQDRDHILVSGTIGDGALGLRLAQMPELAQRWGLTPAEAGFLVQRYRRPQPRLGLRSALQNNVSAAMDISDGLAIDLRKFCKSGGVAGRIDAGGVPLSGPARKALIADPVLLETILTGGDDYELLLTVNPARHVQLMQDAAECGVPLTLVGKIAAGRGIEIILADGRQMALERLGWDHFRPSGP